MDNEIRYRPGGQVLDGARVPPLGREGVTRGELVDEVKHELFPDERSGTKIVDRALILALEYKQVMEEHKDELTPELAKKLGTSQGGVKMYPQYKGPRR